MTSLLHKCGLCDANASKRCSACNEAWYCCKDHQIIHWAQHKNKCNYKSQNQNNRNRRSQNDKSKKAANTPLQKLHNHCLGNIVFTEIDLPLKINKNNEDKIQKLLENALKNMPDTFVYHNRIIIASNKESFHRSIFFKMFDTIRANVPFYLNEEDLKTRYHLSELLYSNGFLSNKGVTFCSKNKTIQTAHISEFFEHVSYVLKECVDELAVFGYCRQLDIRKDVPQELASICLSYYECKEEFSICGHAIQKVNETQIVKSKPYVACCAFGTVALDSTSKNHYQWILYINKMHSDFFIGISSEKNVEELFVNKDYPNYSYSENGSVNNCNRAPCKHKGKTLRFVEGDTILMDLDFSSKQLKFCINGPYEGCLIEDIICGPTYYLGVCMSVLYDSVSIKRFNWWNAPE